MDYNLIKEIKKCLNKQISSMGGLFYTTNCEEEFQDDLKDIRLEVASGASKLVFMPFDEKYVIKIPFNGNYKAYQQEYTSFEMANTYNYWDYCLKELEIYHKAKAKGLGKFFAKIRLIENNEHPIYIQEKAVLFSEASDWEGLEFYYGQKHSTEDIGYSYPLSIPNEWLEIAISHYGKIMVDRLINFLINEYLDDFHDGNLGFINGKPVIIDYSGYND